MEEEERSVMFGRRPDGRRIDKIDPVMKITPAILPERINLRLLLFRLSAHNYLPESTEKHRSDQFGYQ